MFKRLLPLAALAAIVSITLVGCGTAAPPPASTPTPVGQSPPPPPPATVPTPTQEAPGAPETPSGGGDGTPVDVNLEDPGGSGEYMFDPSEFSFSAGETVSFTYTSETEFHTFTVDELGINVDVDAGDTQTLTFTFDEPGTYQLICIPHEALGMTGTITVQ